MSFPFRRLVVTVIVAFHLLNCDDAPDRTASAQETTAESITESQRDSNPFASDPLLIEHLKTENAMTQHVSGDPVAFVHGNRDSESNQETEQEETQQEETQQDEVQEMELPIIGQPLTDEQIAAFMKLAIDNIDKEYPNKPNEVMAGPESVRSPREMHPAFFGSFDWHSCVHQHWMLIRLLKLYPDSELEAEARSKLAANMTAEKILGEVAYFEEEESKSYERMYGWAWYFRLVAELETWDDEQGKEWRENLRPLEDLLVQRTIEFLPKLDFPIRTGVHPDTGFGLGQTLDYARVIGNTELEELIVQRAKDYYGNDVNYPTMYEPSGQDFFSSCLNEADLMRRVLTADEFSAWFDKYLPTLAEGDGGNLLVPVTVSDVTDGYIVHLAGLDLSRGWCMQGIASALPEGDARRELLEKSTAEHAKMGYSYVFSGHYEGEHWLATFAVYLQTQVGVDE